MPHGLEIIRAAAPLPAPYLHHCLRRGSVERLNTFLFAGALRRDWRAGGHPAMALEFNAYVATCLNVMFSSLTSPNKNMIKRWRNMILSNSVPSRFLARIWIYFSSQSCGGNAPWFKAVEAAAPTAHTAPSSLDANPSTHRTVINI